MTQTREEVSGRVEKFLFQDQASGFSVAVLQTETAQIIVRGHLSSIQPGQEIQAHGAWVIHPKFGRQFEAATCTSVLPTSTLGLKKYLSSGLIKGIGKTYAEKLVNTFGNTVLEIIDTDPQQLHTIPGIGPKRVETIIAAWQEHKEASQTFVFLQEKGISAAYAAKIYKKYKQHTVSLITQNPYRLAEEIWGIGFSLADDMAHKLGFTEAHPKRIEAGLLHIMGTHAQTGNLYLPVDEAKTLTRKLLSLDAEQHTALLTKALHELYQHDKIKLITHNDEHFITLSSFYHAEKSVAYTLKQLLNYKPIDTFDLHSVHQRIRVAHHGKTLNEHQQQGIVSCLQNKITVITGGPGTGKTTLIKMLLSILEDHNIRYQLAAPTGRAAKRMFEGTSRHAQTIHRLLEFDPITMQFKHNENNALSTDFLIVDEASMIDIFLARSLLKAIPRTAHIVFIGDIDQLPSVGPGNVLRDLITSKRVAVIGLKHIFRQAQDSLIIVNAHRMNNGEFPLLSLAGAKKDFLFIKEHDPANMKAHLEKIYQLVLPRHRISPKNTIVLAPMNRGTAGTHTINSHLQRILNPHHSGPTVTSMGTVFHRGDRVMQIKNNYDKKVFNGDIGVISNIDTTEKKLIVTIDERDIQYEYDELNELVLAYAVSIHKSQGSEYDAVVIPIFMQHFTLLQRNLIYTGVTRAKKLCIIIGQSRALAIAITSHKGTTRKTFLTQFLTEDLACR